MLMLKINKKQDLIKCVRRDLHQVYAYPDTVSSCLADLAGITEEYSTNTSTNLDYDGYNNIFTRLMIKAGILVDYSHIKENNGRIRPITVNDVRNIVLKFLNIIK